MVSLESLEVAKESLRELPIDKLKDYIQNSKNKIKENQKSIYYYNYSLKDTDNIIYNDYCKFRIDFLTNENELLEYMVKYAESLLPKKSNSKVDLEGNIYKG